MKPLPPKKRRKRAAPAKENSPLSKPKTKANDAKAGIIVNVYHGTGAKAAAARIGALHLLPRALDSLTPGQSRGRVAMIEPVSKKWILAILARDAGWICFESKRRDILEAVERHLMPADRCGRVHLEGRVS